MTYLDKQADTLTIEQRELAIVAINAYGNGKHPVASVSTLRFFAISYVARCLRRAAADKRFPQQQRDVSAALAATLAPARKRIGNGR